MTRIVITGIGACNAIGDNADSSFKAFLTGKKGNRPLVHLTAGKYNTPIAYEREALETPDGRFRCSTFLTSALKEAVEHAQVATDEVMPVYVGSGLRELRSAELSALQDQKLTVDQLDFARAVSGVLPKSQNVYTICNACAASNYALALACDRITAGASDIAIAAGCDTITSSMFGLLDRSNPNTPKDIKVFDEQRQGILMGDGGVAIVIERLESALENGRRPLAEIKGVGLSTDAVHETAPDQAGIERALKDAYERAGIAPEDVDLIYVHGTGTELNDATEARALASIYRDIEDKPAIAGIKSMIGHTSGASGGIGVVSAVASLQTQMIPPTPGTNKPIDAARGFGIYDEATEGRLGVVQVNAFGFGGVNSVVVVAAYKGED